jgi:filamentous hemagglutinin family protein
MNRFRQFPMLTQAVSVTLGLVFHFGLPAAWANPQGGSVVHGTASFATSGSQLTIHTSDAAFINWQSFNIGAGESTVFVQPASTSVVWNHINDSNPSQILGNLQANGYVILQNASGFYIGGQATINAPNLIMTTAPTVPLDVMSGGAWDFNTPPPLARIVNYGQISTGSGGSVFLIANDIDNEGGITAPGGTIGLYAGKQVLVSERPDGRGLSASLTLPQGSVDNSGKLIADAGTIAVNAQVVNQGGVVQANSLREVNGMIELVASDSLNLGASSVISAKGDSQGTSSGGNITVKSGNQFTDNAGSVIDVCGGAQGGNGGQVEVSATSLGAVNSQILGAAAPGWRGGQLSIDPQNIILSSSGTSATGSGGSTTVLSTDPPAGTLTLNVGSFSSFSQILLEATQNITVATTWGLGDSLVPDSTLTLEAGGNIIVDKGDYITAGQNWNLNLYAGVVNFAPSSPGLSAGAGNIDLTGTPTGTGGGAAKGFIQTTSGSLSLDAGQNIFVGNGNLQTTSGSLTATAGQNISISAGNMQTSSGLLTATAGQNVTLTTGAIRTTGGGSINVTATSGSVDAGSTATSPNGYVFSPGNNPAYTVSTTSSTGVGGTINLSGISTAAGGDVNITAGLDVMSFLPTGTIATDAGSGAFGPEPGVVTITAGRSVYGHYVAADSERNGEPVASSINAGVNAGASGQLLALSLVTGGWDVNAAENITLQEVRNPSGVYNYSTLPGIIPNLFDYDASDFVNLTAGYGVYLVGAGPRIKLDDVPTIYPSSLSIQAGAGGIDFETPVLLFPSPYGQLSLTTLNGGTLSGSGNSTYDLEMSDSSDDNWVKGASSFLDHASVPLHLNDPNPVVLNISGDMDNFLLVTPKATQITVLGNINNSYFQIQNLHASDVSTVTVDGSYFSRNENTFENLAAPLSSTLAAELGNSVGFLDGLVYANGTKVFSGTTAPDFSYTPGGLVLAITGKLTDDQFNQLVNLDANGNPVSLKALYAPVESMQNGVIVVTGYSPVTFLDLPTLEYFHTATADVPPPPQLTGISNPFRDTIGGPGQFIMTAGSIDLGSSGGILSRGPADNTALAPLSATGANITLNAAQNLTMFSSTIASYFGGNININAGGTVDVGSSAGVGLNNPAAGIYTVASGNVNIVASGTIDLEGSRVATFDGGNINLESLYGDVNAGNGAATDVQVTSYGIDPTTKDLVSVTPVFNGSGILAYTLPAVIQGSDTDNSGNSFNVTVDESTTAQPGNITVTTPRGNIISSDGGIVQEPLNGNEAPGPTVTLTAGTHNGAQVTYLGNIDLSGSGVIGGAINLDASGSITGLVIGRQDTSVNAVQNFNGTLLSGGTASLSAGGTVSGTIIGVAGINVGSGTLGNVQLLSTTVSGAGTGAGLSTTATASATATAASAQTSDTSQQQVASNNTQDDDSLKKNRPLLAKLVKRVTVILPKS